MFYHVCAGLEPVRMSNHVLCATLKGIEKSKTDVKGKDTILPNHLRSLMAVGNFYSDLEFIVCVAALFVTT